MNKEQQKQYRSIIQRVITTMGMYSKEAEDLIFGTGLYESHYKYLTQIGSGIAKSFWQIEVATAQDNINSYLSYRQSLARLCSSASHVPLKYVIKGIDDENVGTMLEYNIAYAIMHCRLKYYRVPKRIPSSMEGQATYYKKYYNSFLGKASEEEYINIHKELLE